ncbi:MAG: AhpC/TSA family protein [Acidimicrobiales bacterium]
MHSLHDDPGIGLVVVGFSPADRLAAIAGHLGWTGRVLSDPDRRLYERLGIGRAPWWRVYSPRTLAIYARALARGQHLVMPEEDTHQLGGDAVMMDGTVVKLWRPRSPDDRPPAAEVLGVARAESR